MPMIDVRTARTFAGVLRQARKDWTVPGLVEGLIPRKGGVMPNSAVRHAALRLATRRRDRIHAQRVLAITILVPPPQAARSPQGRPLHV
jgi:hypothetical protein